MPVDACSASNYQHGLLKVSVLIPGYPGKLLDSAELATRR